MNCALIILSSNATCGHDASCPLLLNPDFLNAILDTQYDILTTD